MSAKGSTIAYAAIFGVVTLVASFLFGCDGSSKSGSKDIEAAREAETEKLLANYRANVAADRAAVAAEFAKDRITIISKMKSLIGAASYDRALELARHYMYVNDTELDALARQAEEKRQAKRVADEKAYAKMQGVTLGMTQEQVQETRWGRPQSKNRTTTVHGTSEQWVYGNGRYLYFTNGVLTAIQD
jgi:hypothetical protein